MARAVTTALALLLCACAQHIEVFTPRAGSGAA